MKRNQREIYCELTALINTPLCSFCRFSEWVGGCEDSYCECQHPLEVVKERLEYYGEPGDDCWGFRALLSVSDIADIAGCIIANGWGNWAYQIDKEKILVFGRGGTR